MQTENGSQNNGLKLQRRNLGWFAIVASLFLLLGIGAFVYSSYSDFDQNSDLGTYDDPEIAFRETQKALSILSNHLNIGIVSVQYIQEYDNSKYLIFKEQK